MKLVTGLTTNATKSPTTISNTFVLSCIRPFVILWAAVLQGPLSMEFPRQAYWSGLPFPSLGDLPDPRIEAASLASPAWQVDSLPLVLPGKPVTGLAIENVDKVAQCHALASKGFVCCFPLVTLPSVHGVTKSRAQLSEGTELNPAISMWISPARVLEDETSRGGESIPFKTILDQPTVSLSPDTWEIQANISRVAFPTHR